MKKIFLMCTIFLLSGCQTVDLFSGQAAIEQKKIADKSLAQIKCQELCQNAISLGQDLSQGPCLSNNLMPDWVCDVGHIPRQAIDNKPENQCLAFLEKQANHFVEVDGNCTIINTN